jgi:porin
MFVCCVSGVAFSLPAGSTALENDETSNTEANEQEDEEQLWFENPGSIAERLEEDVERKDYLFQSPGVDGALKPWYDMKADLAEKHGFRYGISFTHLYQGASDTVGSEDDASGYDLNIDGVWTFLGRGTDRETTLGFQFFTRDTLGTEIPPLTLFTQTGSLYSGGVAYGETDPSIGQLWIQHKVRNVFGFRAGKVFPITAYDFFPFKNFRTDFVDFNHATNAAIPLPDYGLGAFARYKPHPRARFTLGAHDANADVEESGFDTYDDELFTIFEAGFEASLMPREPGRPPHGYVNVSIWHQDEREDAGVDDGWGVAGTVLQRFGRFTPFVRYGYADVGADGPTDIKHMANLGLVTDGIFGQANDRIGVGFTWSDPADKVLDNQSTIDAYYHVQVMREIAVSPTLQIIFDPVRNPDKDQVYVLGIRTRLAL